MLNLYFGMGSVEVGDGYYVLSVYGSTNNR